MASSTTNSASIQIMANDTTTANNNNKSNNKSNNKNNLNNNSNGLTTSFSSTKKSSPIRNLLKLRRSGSSSSPPTTSTTHTKSKNANATTAAASSSELSLDISAVQKPNNTSPSSSSPISQSTLNQSSAAGHVQHVDTMIQKHHHEEKKEDIIISLHEKQHATEQVNDIDIDGDDFKEAKMNQSLDSINLVDTTNNDTMHDLINHAATSSPSSSSNTRPKQTKKEQPLSILRQPTITNNLVDPPPTMKRVVSFSDENGGALVSSRYEISVSPGKLIRRVRRSTGGISMDGNTLSATQWAFPSFFNDRGSSSTGSSVATTSDANQQLNANTLNSSNDETHRLLILLMDPPSKQYELTSISFSPYTATSTATTTATMTNSKKEKEAIKKQPTAFKELIPLISSAASHEPLKKQTYIGFTRPSTGVEMIII